LPVCADPFTVFDHYKNVCVPATLIQFVDQPNMKIIYGILLPILSVIVLISNGVVILVLNEQKTKRATVEPLFWMAVSALLMAASPLPFTIYYYNLDHMRDLNQTEQLCYLQKICMEILPFFFNTLITFFTLLLGTQRFIAVQYPLDSIRWCSRRLIRRYSKAILTLAIVLTVIHSTFDIRVIYHFCIRGSSTSFWVARCFVGHSPLTRAMGPDTFAWVFDCFRIGLIVVPSTLLFVITILLIRTIKTSDAPQLNVNRHKRVSSAFRNTTIMLTVIIVLFLLARVPSMVLIILVKLSDVLPLGSLEFAHSAYLRAFANIILVTLHPISFAVYMFMSRRFRVSLRRLLGWRFLASDEEFHALTSSVRIPQMNITLLFRPSTSASLHANVVIAVQKERRVCTVADDGHHQQIAAAPLDADNVRMVGQEQRVEVVGFPATLQIHEALRLRLRRELYFTCRAAWRYGSYID
uniref:G_PROTEIN_RECEP_F1_2 domain-containing protein n=1 Tax=Heligmosomoides polygyrus TaxID=6339 RepID=A0A183FVI9_HELPZ